MSWIFYYFSSTINYFWFEYVCLSAYLCFWSLNQQFRHSAARVAATRFSCSLAFFVSSYHSFPKVHRTSLSLHHRVHQLFSWFPAQSEYAQSRNLNASCSWDRIAQWSLALSYFIPLEKSWNLSIFLLRYPWIYCSFIIGNLI